MPFPMDWITAEGVFGVPLGVSTLMVFLFVLFGALYGLCGVAHQLCRVVALLDPVKTEIQGFGYDIRTASLPFFFIFNTDLVLIGVNSVWHAIAIFIVALTAMMAFASATQRFLPIRCRL